MDYDVDDLDLDYDFDDGHPDIGSRYSFEKLKNEVKEVVMPKLKSLRIKVIMKKEAQNPGVELALCIEVLNTPYRHHFWALSNRMCPLFIFTGQMSFYHVF